MKINKIYISAFGGLKDFTLELNDGLNVIYGNNEDGKSTVAAFIKSMFYGTGRNSKNLADSLRLKYTPWDNSTMAGRIFFEHSGKRYCLEKEFRKSDSTDRITLTDLDSGKTIETHENIGQQFFGISAAAFERSLFIGNGDFIKDDAAAGEINGKLSNIAVTGNEDVSYKKIEKNILDVRTKLISKSGRSGSYNEDLQTLADLNSRLERANFDALTKTRLNDTAYDKRQQYESLYKKYQQLKTVLDREQDYLNREKLTEFLDTKHRLDQLNQTLTLSNGTIINENFTQKVELGIGLYEKSCERCAQISEDISRIKETIKLQNTTSPENAKEEIVKLTDDVKNLTEQKTNLEAEEVSLSAKVEEANQKLNASQNKKTAFNLSLLIPSFLLLITGVVLAIFVKPIIIACGSILLGVLFGILSFIIKPKNTAEITAAQNNLAAVNTMLAENKTQKNLVQEQINNLNARINNLSTAINADSAVKAQRLADLNEKNETLSIENAKSDSAKQDVFMLLSDFANIDSIEKAKSILSGIKQKTEQQKALKLQLKTASQFLGNIDYADAEFKLTQIKENNPSDSVDFDAAKAEFESVTEKLSVLKDELTAIATELKTSFKNSENPEELKREIALIQEKINSKKEFCDAADLAVSVLEESFYELRRGYGSELEKMTHGIFSSLTDGRYKSVSITDTLDLSVEKSDVFGTRELDYLSLGTTHQAYLSLRLAIATLICNNEPLPIFLDDSLSQYDDTRAARAIAFLKDFCSNGQGVLFTCHNAVCDIAQSQGIKIQKPYQQ